MRHRAITLALPVAAVGVLALGAAGGLAAKHKRPQPCALEGSYTRYRDERVRVYTKSGTTYKTYACSFAVNRRIRIADCSGTELDIHCEDVAALEVSPPRIAYALRVNDRAEGQYGIVCVLNLRTAASRCASSDYVVPGLGLSPGGSLVWTDTPGLQACCAVYKIAAGTRHRVRLDYGPDLEGSSLAVAGTHVYWTKAGEPHSTTVP